MRRSIGNEIVGRMAESLAPSCLILPLGGVQAWDRPGEPLHDPEGLAAMGQQIRSAASQIRNLNFSFIETAAHINDSAFSDLVLRVFDEWLAKGWIKR